MKVKPQTTPPCLAMHTTLFAPGDRVCLAVSGGADSIAMLRAMAALPPGLVLSVLHVEHGLRGEASREDAAFVAELAANLGIPCEVLSVDTRARAARHGESIEAAARWLRYEAFRTVLLEDRADRIATAHTQNDQAETVMMKLLRGAWTEGLSGIAPELRLVDVPGRRGCCVRPLLATTRSEVETYLRAIGQPWREDATNSSEDYTRNRVRHTLMPILRQFNPRAEAALAHVADCARSEERFWAAELERVLPRLLLPGRPVRGGGRRVGTEEDSAAWAIEIHRLGELDPALFPRVLRAAAERCGGTLDFAATERLVAMAGHGIPAERRLTLPGGVQVERTARELQFARSAVDPDADAPSYILPVPGIVEAPAFGLRLQASAREGRDYAPASVRSLQPGDRVRPFGSARWKRPKEVLERMGAGAAERRQWPVVAWEGEILWMRDILLAPSDAGIVIQERTPGAPGPDDRDAPEQEHSS